MEKESRTHLTREAIQSIDSQVIGKTTSIAEVRQRLRQTLVFFGDATKKDLTFLGEVNSPLKRGIIRARMVLREIATMTLGVPEAMVIATKRIAEEDVSKVAKY